MKISEIKMKRSLFLFGGNGIISTHRTASFAATKEDIKWHEFKKI